ncbi:MAG: hypothetical protein ACK53J_12855, partial [Betaproteobacteria bacterium]
MLTHGSRHDRGIGHRLQQRLLLQVGTDALLERRLSQALRTLGPAGLREMTEQAVLNAHYMKAQLQEVLPVPQGEFCMHEFVASAKTLKDETGITAMDIAKRLLD